MRDVLRVWPRADIDEGDDPVLAQQVSEVLEGVVRVPDGVDFRERPPLQEDDGHGADSVQTDGAGQFLCCSA
jgi:hypothetical protein